MIPVERAGNTIISVGEGNSSDQIIVQSGNHAPYTASSLVLLKYKENIHPSNPLILRVPISINPSPRPQQPSQSSSIPLNSLRI